jgi:hypothetical protein
MGSRKRTGDDCFLREVRAASMEHFEGWRSPRRL